jgi:hypothetical protein
MSHWQSQRTARLCHRTLYYKPVPAGSGAREMLEVDSHYEELPELFLITFSVTSSRCNVCPACTYCTSCHAWVHNMFWIGGLGTHHIFFEVGAGLGFSRSMLVSSALHHQRTPYSGRSQKGHASFSRFFPIYHKHGKYTVLGTLRPHWHPWLGK